MGKRHFETRGIGVLPVRRVVRYVPVRNAGLGFGAGGALDGEPAQRAIKIRHQASMSLEGEFARTALLHQRDVTSK